MREFHPKRLASTALGTPSSSGVEDSSKPVVTTSQVSLGAAMPDITKPIDQTPEVVCAPTTPPAKTTGLTQVPSPGM